jgi:hypothetical protein
LLGFIRRLELKPNSEQKAENIFVAPPYSQTACCAVAFRRPMKSEKKLPCTVYLTPFVKQMIFVIFAIRLFALALPFD